MNASIKISIVVPSYNQAEFIEGTLLSVINQDYPNKELIVIDGGSTDGTLGILRRYAEHIKYWVSEKDGGQTHALIKGFNVSSGDVFCWLCSDDQFLPGTLSTVSELFGQDNLLQMVYGDTDYLYPNGERVSKPRIAYHYDTMLRAFNIIAQPSSFFTADIYRSVGGLDPSLNYAMDYDLFLRFGREVRWKQVRRPLSLYRIHPSSKTVSQAERFEEEWWRCREKITGEAKTLRAMAMWHLYTMRVVLRFFVERRIIKIGYDRRKYRAS